MKKKILLFVSCVAFFSTMAQTPTAFSGCPDINLAILRAGTNFTTGPVSIYSLNTSNGMPSSISGAIADPANPAMNLQINGLGLNTLDGFLYGLSANAVTVTTTNTPLPFYRLGSNAEAEQIGNLQLPTRVSGENLSFINPSAGEVDRADNYYFTGATAITNPSTLATQIDRLFIGKVANVTTLTASTSAVINPTYTLITSSDPNCAAFISSLTAVYPLATAATMFTAGIQDLVYDNLSGNLYSYVTYSNPGSPSTFFGLMIKIDPSTGF